MDSHGCLISELISVEDPSRMGKNMQSVNWLNWAADKDSENGISLRQQIRDISIFEPVRPSRHPRECFSVTKEAAKNVQWDILAMPCLYLSCLATTGRLYSRFLLVNL